jgi:hypothetical protein
MSDRHAPRWPALVLAAIGAAIVIVFPLRYAMPFRLDDVLLMEWANTHNLLDAFSPDKGQIVNSVRPVFAVTAWLLTHYAGVEHPVVWHVTLVALLVTALVYLARFARYISRGDAALVLTPVLYLIGFTAILNVFFWFSDLTYALELAFTTIAWYYGVRGLREGSLSLWIISIVAGILAVLSKEPAVVMVHVVLMGTFLLDRVRIRSVWTSRSFVTIAVLAYLLLAAATVYVLSVSPTRINRFFALGDPDLRAYMSDRLAYYNSMLGAPIVRVLYYFPIIFLGLHRLVFRSGRVGFKYAVGTILLALAISVIAMHSALVVLPVIVLIMTALATSDAPESGSARALLPFLATVLIAFATLLVTIQLVKTQLTEIAFMATLISAWAWIAMSRVVWPAFAPYRRYLTPAALVLIAIAIVIVAPKFARQEMLLREASAVRWNANDAVLWAARQLPRSSTLAVTTYSLHGFDNPGVLTAVDDERKLREQPTFDAGYVYTFLEQLGRHDIDRAYLTDITTTPAVFEAYRAVPNSFVLLQTSLDRESLGPLLRQRDTLVARFDKPPYPSEIWMLRQ